jgi:hypothetical protein
MKIKKISHDLLAECALVFASFLLYMSKPWESTLQALDSAIHGRLALAVTSDGWLPVLPIPVPGIGHPDFFNDHPFPIFYISGLWMRFFGPSAWSARFIASFFGVLTIVVMYRYGKKFLGESIAYLSAFILMTTPMMIQMSARFQLDPAMIFFTVLSFFYWLDRKEIRSGLCVGLAVVSKAPVGLLLLPAVLIFQIVERKTNLIDFLKRFFKLGFFSLVPIAVVWGFANARSGQNLFFEYVSRQVLGTAVKGRGFGANIDPFAFFTDTLRYRHPAWTILAIVAFTTLMIRNRQEFVKLSKSPPIRLAFASAMVVIVMITLIRFKVNYYYLPAFPFLAVLFAGLIDRAFHRFVDFLKQGMVLVIPVVGVLLLILPLSTCPEMFPVLKRFTAIIQSHGDCRDRVLFVDHAQPYGSKPDYFAEILFYTNRQFTGSDCAEANAFLKSADYRWVIASGSHPTDCISSELLKPFTYRVKMGNQFLLGKVKPDPEFMDLTPLHRELIPVVGCDVEPLKSDQFKKI